MLDLVMRTFEASVRALHKTRGSIILQNDYQIIQNNFHFVSYSSISHSFIARVHALVDLIIWSLSASGHTF